MKGGIGVYSRRFYGGERTQRSRPSPSAVYPSEKIVTAEKKVERNMEEALPMMALVIPVTEDGIDPPREYANPRDFLPESNERGHYDAPQFWSDGRTDGTNSEDITLNNKKSEEKDRTSEFLREVSVYPDDKADMPMSPNFPSNMSDEADEGFDQPNGNPQDSDSSNNSDVYDKMGDVSLSMRNMTFEDMILTGLLMLGSSGEYDDDIMLILGLILMMGA